MIFQDRKIWSKLKDLEHLEVIQITIVMLGQPKLQYNVLKHLVHAKIHFLVH